MALDGIVVSALVASLQSCIGARIHKIHQHDSHELVLSIRGREAQGKLLLSANPTYPRLHWTDVTYSNPLEAPMFCMLVRKHCEGGVIEAVRQVGRERVIHMEIKHRNEVGDLSAKTLIIEIMGRHSNIILTDSSGTILDGIHHVTPAISSHRIIMPGTAYTPPPEQHKVDPLAVTTFEQFEQALQRAADLSEKDLQDARERSPKLLVAAFSGLSPLIATEVVYRADAQAKTDETTLHEWYEAFAQLVEQVKAQAFEPVIVHDHLSGKTLFSCTRLTHIAGESRSFANISDCLEAFYSTKAERDSVKQRASDLIRFVQNERDKNVTKIRKLDNSLEEAKDADRLRVTGELITAYMHQINKGDESMRVVNYYLEEQPEVEIALDPGLTPAENAQRYFRRYAKLRNSKQMIAEQVDLAQTEITYFEGLLQQLETASLADIEGIREELIEQKYMRDRHKRGPRRKKPTRPALLCYTSSEGIAIYVGKNNLQNEYLTNRLASSNDTWLHTKDIPGSHVVIRSNQFSDATLEEAAILAAYYSQARESSSVPVDYTLIRHVRKPSGAKPGYVIYEQQQTVFITPDARRIEALDSKIVS